MKIKDLKIVFRDTRTKRVIAVCPKCGKPHFIIRYGYGHCADCKFTDKVEP